MNCSADSLLRCLLVAACCLYSGTLSSVSDLMLYVGQQKHSIMIMIAITLTR